MRRTSSVMRSCSWSNRTRWERDLLGRATREVRADGVTATTYVYSATSGRLVTMTDPKEQVTTYSYALDTAALSTVYTNAEVATANGQLHVRCAVRSRGNEDRWNGRHHVRVPPRRGPGRRAAGDCRWPAYRRHDHLHLRPAWPGNSSSDQQRGCHVGVRCARSSHERSQCPGYVRLHLRRRQRPSGRRNAPQSTDKDLNALATNC